jgi:hypothetical protein
MSRTSSTEAIATLRIDIGKNVFHLIGLNRGPPLFCAKKRPVATARCALPTRRFA